MKINALNRAVVGAAAFVVASTVPLTIAAVANADAITDVLTAAQVPLNTAETAITAATAPGNDISTSASSLLEFDNQFLSDQYNYLGELASVQEQLTAADKTDLADLDKLLYTTDESVLYHTTAFISAAETAGPVSEFYAGAELLNADFSAIGTDFNVAFGSTAIDLLAALGIPNSVLG